MADPIGAASGILALVAFGFSASKSLYQTIESLKDHPRNVRELKQEVEALMNVLQSLNEFVSSNDVDLAVLELPLSQCGKACKEFESVIVKCTANSEGSKISVRDWAKLRYMGSDINGFKDMIAGYKSTITIALGSATLRITKVTADFLGEYKEMIRETKIDLEERLHDVDQRLQDLSSRESWASREDIAERQRVQEERDSTQQCLQICIQASAYLDSLQPTAVADVSTPADSNDSSTSTTKGISSRSITTNTLKDCKEKLLDTVSQLERKLLDIKDLKIDDSRITRASSVPPAAEQARLQEELESIKQCLAICTEASSEANQQRTNIFEDVSIAEDGQQVLVSTIGDLIRAQRITAGARSSQWFGQMSDTSLQQISRDRSQTTSDRFREQQTRDEMPFENRYGKGRNLSPASASFGAKSK
ncbi:hypothetical protein B0J12DRAFT_680021 [Macrophomina phaseolina]|uniref:Azaphilone pigments biosynthesis cluster protein L N-terminal domain-containing protein n=1 Tax=Macrophomina phaseolina TaxID=35725 RepID=A0ABQ8G0F0_9PEZI|nr:hypothetical protein B0J12DRAFT_680021 [Macrophomina phaseolina]